MGVTVFANCGLVGAETAGQARGTQCIWRKSESGASVSTQRRPKEVIQAGDPFPRGTPSCSQGPGSLMFLWPAWSIPPLHTHVGEPPGISAPCSDQPKLLPEIVLLRMCSPDQRSAPGTCQKCRLPGPTPDPLNQSLRFPDIPAQSSTLGGTGLDCGVFNVGRKAWDSAVGSQATLATEERGGQVCNQPAGFQTHVLHTCRPGPEHGPRPESAGCAGTGEAGTHLPGA